MFTQFKLLALRSLTSRKIQLLVPLAMALISISGNATGGGTIFGQPTCGGGSTCGG